MNVIIYANEKNVRRNYTLSDLKEIDYSVNCWEKKNAGVNVDELCFKPADYGCFYDERKKNWAYADMDVIRYVKEYGVVAPKVGSIPFQFTNHSYYAFNAYKQPKVVVDGEVVDYAKITPEQRRVLEAKFNINYFDVVNLHTETYYCKLSKEELNWLQVDREFTFKEIWDHLVGSIRGSKRSIRVTDENREEYLFGISNSLDYAYGSFISAAKERGFNFHKLNKQCQFKNGFYGCFITIDQLCYYFDVPKTYTKTVRDGLIRLGVVKYVDDKFSSANVSYNHKPNSILNKEKRLLVNVKMFENCMKVLHNFKHKFINKAIEISKNDEVLRVAAEKGEDYVTFERVKPYLYMKTELIPKNAVGIITQFLKNDVDIFSENQEEKNRNPERTNLRKGKIPEDLLFKCRGMQRVCNKIVGHIKEKYDFDIIVQKIVELMSFCHTYGNYSPSDIALCLLKHIKQNCKENAIQALKVENKIKEEDLYLLNRANTVEELQVRLNKLSKEEFNPKLHLLQVGIVDDFKLKVRGDNRGLSGRVYSKFCSIKKGEKVEKCSRIISNQSVPDEVIDRNPQRYQRLVNGDIKETFEYDERDMQARRILGCEYISKWDVNASVHRTCYNLFNNNTLSHRDDYYLKFLDCVKSDVIKDETFNKLANANGMTPKQLFNSFKWDRDFTKGVGNPVAFCKSYKCLKQFVLDRLNVVLRCRQDWRVLCEVIARVMWRRRDMLCGKIRGGVLFFLEGFVMTHIKGQIYKKYGVHSLLVYDCIYAPAFITDDMFEAMYDDACRALKKIVGVDEDGYLFVK